MMLNVFSMKVYFLIFLFQVFFNIFKVLEIKFTYENKLKLLLINSVFINLVSLASIYYSIGELLKGDFLVVFFYILGSVIGKWIAMEKIENYRSKILKFFKKIGDNI